MRGFDSIAQVAAFLARIKAANERHAKWRIAFAYDPLGTLFAWFARQKQVPAPVRTAHVPRKTHASTIVRPHYRRGKTRTFRNSKGQRFLTRNCMRSLLADMRRLRETGGVS